MGVGVEKLKKKILSHIRTFQDSTDTVTFPCHWQIVFFLLANDSLIKFSKDPRWATW